MPGLPVAVQVAGPQVSPGYEQALLEACDQATEAGCIAVENVDETSSPVVAVVRFGDDNREAQIREEGGPVFYSALAGVRAFVLR